jgi:hypothetical protein
VASTGPIPINLGSTPTTAEHTIFANGFRFYFSIARSDAIITAAAPSFNPEALPAVTVPCSFIKAVLNFANIAKVELGLMNSSLLNPHSAIEKNQ